MISKCILVLAEIGKDGAYIAWQLSPRLQDERKMNYTVPTSMPRILQSFFSEFAFHCFDWCLALTNFQKNHMQAISHP